MPLKKTPFVGRKQELRLLEDATELGGAKLIVVQGRRRVGKTRLIEKFAEGKRFLYFAGIAPQIAGSAKQAQIDEFLKFVFQHFSVKPQEPITDWFFALRFLSNQLTKDIPTVIMLDEISWMGSGDEDYFVASLKSWWDESINWHYSDLTLVISGSVSTWIEKNIIRSTAFFGRITQQIELQPMKIPEAIRFLRKRGYRSNLRSLLEILVVTGGIPWYMEQFNPTESTERNIIKLFFTNTGLLFKEFDLIFHDLFNGDTLINKQILQFLIDGSKPLEAIGAHLKWPKDEYDKLAAMLDQLKIAGFIRKHYQWSLKKKDTSSDSLFSINDCFVRFYLKYVEPDYKRIESGSSIYSTTEALPAWATIKGLQLETLLLQNRDLLYEALRCYDARVINAGPFLQRATKDLKGCQIDYLVQTKDEYLIVCEFKFGKQKIGLEIIPEMKEKISRLEKLEDFVPVPVLFHFGEVAPEVIESDYFFRIVSLLKLCAEEDEV